ncbi:MAG: hypothetical protein KC546_17680 [Anaerolineae bacterium]|nr:hypothetical protein [Anaerolineae bacterium]
MTEYTFDDKPKNDDKAKRTGSPLSWSQVFQLVLARPSVKSFEVILDDPMVSRSRAWSWIAIACAISVAITVIWLMTLFSTPVDSLSTLIYGGFTFFFTVIFVAFGFYLTVRLLQLSARILGGRTMFLDLFYAMAAFNAPLMVINYGVSVMVGGSGGTGLLSFNLVSLFLSLYQVLLTAMAIKATSRFGWGRTIAAMIVFCVIVVAIYMLIIGAIVFSVPYPTPL